MWIELPAPGTLRVRWGALAAAMTAIGYDDVWWFDADGAHHDDHGGNWARLVFVEGGRTVLFGFDHEYSGATTASPPIDLLAGAPAWLPWPELLRAADAAMLGYAYWHDGERWARVDYPDQVDDGLRATLGRQLDGDGLADVVLEWTRHDGDPAPVHAAAAALLDAAGRGAVDAGALEALVGPVNIPAGTAMATRAGLTPGAAVATVPAADGPPPRRVRVLSDRQHEQLVWTAMRAATEIARPEPVATTELAALVAWARDHAPDGDGRCTVLFEMVDNAARQEPGEAPPADREPGADWATFRAANDLVGRLRAVEADRAHGHWIFVRLETSATGYTIERRYDSWPEWIPYDGITGPWLDHLRPEMDRRAAAYRPDWTTLLAPDVAFSDEPA